MFKKVTLYTNKLNEMKGFYEYQLGFRLVEEDETSFTLAIGDSQLVFKESARGAIYHYALNIPGNQFTLAKGWARSRVELNRQEGMDEIFYANFQADAFYFQDPAGNVVEFIGRRNVDRMGDFTVDSLLNISEVSITTSHVQEVGEQIEDMEIPVRGNKGIDPKSLNFLGSGDAFIILVSPKRTWYFSKQRSEVHPLTIELRDGRSIEITEDGKLQRAKPVHPITEGMERLDFTGVALLKTEETWSAAKGYADRSDERPNAIATRFGIASGSKIFTAVTVCQLVEEGKLRFEDRLSELLPETFPEFDVTIHQLLTHTSGIPDYFDESVMDNFEELWKTQPMYLLKSASDFVPLFNKKEMAFAPGEKFHYNNAGYIALGLVVEKLTGQDFTEAVAERVFLRAGMVNAGYFSLDRMPPQTAHGYIEEDQGWRTNQYAIPIKGGADGGAFATAGDMTSFWERLMDFSLLSEDLTKQLLQPHVTRPEGAYGYGIWVSEQEGRTVYEVKGHDPGVSFHSVYFVEDRAILTVLSNKGEGAADVMKLIEAEKLK
ncbi:MAG TPA: serine hydrolase [Planococcus sp. (in: firmicutes)]|nr:serine hydrolase [Planococcus sp. (in: firmicutes)]